MSPLSCVSQPPCQSKRPECLRFRDSFSMGMLGINLNEIEKDEGQWGQTPQCPSLLLAESLPPSLQAKSILARPMTPSKWSEHAKFHRIQISKQLLCALLYTSCLELRLRRAPLGIAYQKDQVVVIFGCHERLLS